MENWLHCCAIPGYDIITTFCAGHDSTAAVPCANFAVNNGKFISEMGTSIDLSNAFSGALIIRDQHCLMEQGLSRSYTETYDYRLSDTQ